MLYLVSGKTKSEMTELLNNGEIVWMNNKAFIEFGFRRIWRIHADLGGCYPPPNNGLKATCNLGLLCTSLILDIHVMINWRLSNQCIRWSLSCDHIAGASSHLVEVEGLFWSWPLTKCWFFDWIAGSRLVNSLKTGQVCSEAGQLTQD